MTLQTEPAVNRKTQSTFTNSAPRGGSYVTLPVDREITPRFQGSYVSVPGVLPGNANKRQGTYVTLHSAPAEKTEMSYTRVGQSV